MRNNEKTMQIDVADSNLGQLGEKISYLRQNHDKCTKKYSKLQSMLKKILSLEKQQDPLLDSQLKQMSSENVMIQKDLDEIKDKIPILELKKNEIGKSIQDQMATTDLTGVF
jgi:hypothetical protein